jgi:alpha-N-arabinofuranosidase
MDAMFPEISARYQSRWNSFVTNLTATFPQLRKKIQLPCVNCLLISLRIDFMATSRTTTPVLTPTPQHYDVHLYQTPSV